MVKLVWRVPISTQHPSTKWVAHLMPNTKSTKALYQTLCGRDVNPGFASPPCKTTTECRVCLRKAQDA